jgi:prophage antirepressor-like protein
MTAALVAARPQFEGTEVAVVEWKGQQIWSAGQVATAWGYASVTEISENITSNWSEELTLGEDYLILAGEDLAPLKAAGIVGANAPRATFLTESGVNLVAILSRKPKARAFRRWLATVVLPAIRRTGSYTGKPLTLAERARDLVVQLAAQGRDAGEIDRILTLWGGPEYVESWERKVADLNRSIGEAYAKRHAPRVSTLGPRLLALFAKAYPRYVRTRDILQVAESDPGLQAELGLLCGREPTAPHMARSLGKRLANHAEIEARHDTHDKTRLFRRRHSNKT